MINSCIESNMISSREEEDIEKVHIELEYGFPGKLSSKSLQHKEIERNEGSNRSEGSLEENDNPLSVLC